MQHVNNDNNDDLYRRAAENYPLKTDSSDWDLLLKKLQTASIIPSSPAKRNRIYWPFLLLFLILPFKIYENSLAHPKINLTDGSQIQGNAFTPYRSYPAESNNASVSIGDQENVTILDVAPELIFKKETNPGKEIPDVGLTLIKQSHQPTVKSPFKQPFSSSARKNVGGLTRENSRIVWEIKKISLSPSTPMHLESQTYVQAKSSDPDTSGKMVAKVNEKEVNAGKNEKKKGKNSNKFYLGIIGGPDLSTVKWQPVKKTGFNIGIIAGYQLKRFRLETGILKDKKYYGTKGKYFHSKINYSPDYYLEYAEGECNMIEIPINLSYTFRNNKRSSWFLATGMSSYFMRNESYLYNIDHNGQRYSRTAKYDTKSTRLLSVVNISAGFRRKMGSIGELRFEPFVKLPVSKIGTGNLSIQSAGIFVGFTKNIL